MKCEEFFSEDGLLARTLPDYEHRSLQLDMANDIEKAVEEKKHIIIEAGTGTGKSFAYLVPLILHSLGSGERVVVSTNTKSLQQQMVKKDLPFLKELLKEQELDFSFKVFYGSQNYLCRKRAEEFLSGAYLGFHLKPKDRQALTDALEQKGATGIRYDMKSEIKEHVWQGVNREADLCLKKKCRFYEQCFYYGNLKELYSTDVIVVNHPLFFAHVKSNYSLLPKFSVFVWDEAHNIEDTAARFLADTVSEAEVNFLFAEIHSIYEREGETPDPKIRGMLSSFKRLFDYFRENFSHNTRIKDQLLPRDVLDEYIPFLSRLKEELKRFAGKSDEQDLELEVLMARMSQVRLNLEAFLAHDSGEMVYWIEKIGRKQSVDLKRTPVNIASYLKEKVFDLFSTAVLTSATLSAGSSFAFIRSRLGLEECLERIFPSPFNFKKQVQLYINGGIALPSENEKYIRDISREILKLLRISQGKAFILFTSYETLKAVKKQIENEMEFTLLVQNEKPFPRLLREFKADVHSVLMATMSFWEGVDVPGEALSSVIITRLPFDMPEEPLVSARIEYIKKQGGNPFIEYQLPNAVILLKQGFGRLIRNSRDKGLVAILDPRIARKSYGRIFLNSLPECGWLEPD